MTSRAARFLTVAPLLAATAVGLSACADFMSDDGLQQDVALLRQDVNSLKVSAQRGRAEADAVAQIDRRTKDLAAENTRQAAESSRQSAENARQIEALSSRIEAMNTEMRKMASNVTELSQRVDELKRQAQARPAQPPAFAAPPTTTPPSVLLAPSTPRPGAPAAPAAPPSDAARADTARAIPAPPPTSTASAEETYQAANRDFSQGRYELAIRGFRDFVRRFPDAAQADSAQYNIGESYWSLAQNGATSGQPDKSRSDMEQAVQEFRKVIVNYPRGAKVAPALYKEALALTELKQVTLAQSRLQYLIDHFPQSEEAPLAKEKLAALKP